MAEPWRPPRPNIPIQGRTPVEDKGLVVLPIHRVLHNLAFFDPLRLLKELDQFFEIQVYKATQKTSARTRKKLMADLQKLGKEKHVFGMYLGENKFYLLTLRDEKIVEEMVEEEKRLVELKEILKQGIQESIPDIVFNSPENNCLPTTLNCSFYGAEGEAILLYLDLEGIEVSTGSACASGSLDPSHVLLAIGIPIEAAHGSIRMSLGRQTTKQDVKHLCHY